MVGIQRSHVFSLSEEKCDGPGTDSERTPHAVEDIPKSGVTKNLPGLLGSDVLRPDDMVIRLSDLGSSSTIFFQTMQIAFVALDFYMI